MPPYIACSPERPNLENCEHLVVNREILHLLNFLLNVKVAFSHTILVLIALVSWTQQPICFIECMLAPLLVYASCKFIKAARKLLTIVSCTIFTATFQVSMSLLKR